MSIIQKKIKNNNLKRKYNLTEIFYVTDSVSGLVVPVVFNEDKTELIDLLDGQQVNIVDKEYASAGFFEGEYIYYIYGAKDFVSNKYKKDKIFLMLEDFSWLMYRYVNNSAKGVKFLDINFKIFVRSMFKEQERKTVKELIKNKKVTPAQLKPFLEQLNKAVVDWHKTNGYYI